MGGKGRRRREKNYQAAHGGHSRLPPPPSASSVDAVPSKLRKLMDFVNSPHPGLAKTAMSSELRNASDGDIHTDKKLNSKQKLQSRSSEIKDDPKNEDSVVAPFEDQDDDFTNTAGSEEKRKKTKKRKRATDLRFETLEGAGLGSGRRERKKKRLKERKEKQKKARSDEKDDFPRHEQIKFGDIVQAPPKLLAIPKGSKAFQDASHERLRLRAIEAYRNRKGIKSRTDISVPVITSPVL